MQSPKTPIFREIQYMRHVWWVMVLVLGIAILMWWGFYHQIILGQPWGSNPGPDWSIWLFWFIFGLIFPVGFYFMRLDVQVSDDHLSIRFIPFSNRRIAISEIGLVESVKYNPIREYGGWGIRGGSSRKAYTISSNQGVKLTLLDGSTVLIGSKNPHPLALAIQSRLPSR